MSGTDSGVASASGGIAAGEAPLVLEGVRFGYEPGTPIVQGVCGRVEAGKLCVLLGPNAAGKSTLLRLMLGQLRPDAGRVLLLGHPASELAPRRRAAMVSYVPQRAGVSFAFTIEQVVAMGRYAHSGGEAAVDEALRRCDLLDLRRRVFAQLSFGQQQRVLLARAMAQAMGGGRLMLLDEPGSAMDLWHVHHMMGTLTELARAGLAVMVVLHDLNLAARYADAVWLMHEGRLAAAGPWREVLTPGVLEPIYRVRLLPVSAAAVARPAFLVEPA